jgi:hypothetical protein
MRGKLLVALQLEVLHHFIERFTRGRSRRLKPPGAFRASKTVKAPFFDPYNLGGQSPYSSWFVTVVFFSALGLVDVNTRTLLLKECRSRANVARAAAIPLIAFFLAAYSVQGSLDESRFAALWWPNFTGVVVIGQGVKMDKARSCRPDTICREGEQWQIWLALSSC